MGPLGTRLGRGLALGIAMLCLPSLAATPHGLVSGERSRDVGKVAPLARIPWVVTLTNATAHPVEVRNVRTSCSCLVVPWRAQTLPPRSRTEMPLELIASGLSGPFTESLDLETTHPDASRVHLEVRGEVFQPVESIPPFVVLPITPDSWRDEVVTARIVNHEARPIPTPGFKSLHASFAGRITPLRDGFEYLLEMRATGPLPNGNHYGRFEVATTSTNVPKLEVTAFVPGLPAVAIGPRALRMRPDAGPSTTSSPVFIRSTTTHGLDIRAEGTPEGTRALLHVVEPGRLYRLALVTQPGFLGLATNASPVRLVSNHPSHPTLTVPVVPADPINAKP
ncbi:MAG: DUF1573 domain-containing protein [Verrucomicrobiota bacterium]